MHRARFAGVVVSLIVMAAFPAFGGSGDTPGDPHWFNQREINFGAPAFTWDANPEDAVYTFTSRVVGVADSVLFASGVHWTSTTDTLWVTDIPGATLPVIQGDPGQVNAMTVWGENAGAVLRCVYYVAVRMSGQANGCGCKPR